MNHDIAKLLEDHTLARNLKSLTSLADATALLVDAAARRGINLGAEAVKSALQAEPGRPRELGADELLMVGGGAPAETWGSACGNSTFGHTCCWHCY